MRVESTSMAKISANRKVNLITEVNVICNLINKKILTMNCVTCSPVPLL